MFRRSIQRQRSNNSKDIIRASLYANVNDISLRILLRKNNISGILSTLSVI